MTKPRARVLALITVLLGTLLSVPAASVANDGTTSGFQRFILVQTDPTVDGGPVAAIGPIHARGTDVVLSDFKDRFEFPDGNVVIKHKPAAGGSTDSFDEVTCLFTFRELGTWKAVRGTGAYADVSGHGTYAVLGQGFGCDENQPPEVFFVRIRAVGQLSY